MICDMKFFLQAATKSANFQTWICVLLLVCGCFGDKNEDKRLDTVTESSLPVTQNGKSRNGSPNKVEAPTECREDCEKDKLGLDAIKSLHHLIDDDQNGNVDQSESDEFLRDELQYTDGFERQALFHNNDKLISVDDLWKAWKRSAVYNWTVDDVVEWLVQDVDLPQYSNTFHNNAIDGSVLPRLVNSTNPLLQALGIRNPVHKQKLSLKAMDIVLFGAPKRVHSYAKDILLVSSLIIAIGGCWFACLHHRYSQTQVKKMMKDLESLQKAEESLKKLSKELAEAEKNQVSMSHDKQEELRILRQNLAKVRSCLDLNMYLFLQNSIRLKVPQVAGGDKSPVSLSREGSVLRRREGERKLQQAEEELASLREALSQAENRLEIQQQLESQWSVPGELQAWLQLTHELEQIHYNAKRQAAERQLAVARDGCDKIKKRNKAFFGSLRMAHSNSLDDIDQSILDARAALEEVKQDLQERLHRWHTIELLCGFPVISNPGLAALKQALGRDIGDLSRIPGSLLAPVSIDEADEDLPPTAPANRGYTGTTLPPSGKSSTFLKQQVLDGSTASLSHVGKVPIPGHGGATLARRGSRDNELNGYSPVVTPTSSNMSTSPSAVSFHLGEGSHYTNHHERSQSNGSISQALPNGQPRAGINQSMSYPPYGQMSSPPLAISPGLSRVGSSGQLLSSNTIPRANHSSMKIYSSPSNNHLMAQHAAPANHTDDPKITRSDSRDILNNNLGHMMLAASPKVPAPTTAVGILHHVTQQLLDESDSASFDSNPRNHSSAMSHMDQTPELDLSSLDTDSLYGGKEVAQKSEAPTDRENEKKQSRKKKFLPKFLLKHAGKQKTS
ncbi:stromal interaction molecule 1-like isoform X6 [Physella acuta]|uniref:stromal interaction molecule 1-like isoform X6 n=1 Tax=Physella acuta TaxID=109671 RepID=UPI0027DC2203|nr:stromal interaction molecule 1-like isoform X6 [Physella acuta]